MPTACQCLLSVQNARVTGNKATGLVVDGSANVTINLTDFIENRRDRWGGSALIALGSSTLTVYGTTFRDNKHGRDAQHGGEDMQLPVHNYD